MGVLRDHKSVSRLVSVQLGGDPAYHALVMRLSCGQNGEDLLPLVLLRRIMWLFGCWAEQIPDVLRPRLVQGIANVMQVG